jgi:transposase
VVAYAAPQSEPRSTPQKEEASHQQLAYSDAHIATVARSDARVEHLQSVPSVGPVTAAAFVAALDDAGRFVGDGALAVRLPRDDGSLGMKATRRPRRPYCRAVSLLLGEENTEVCGDSVRP